MNLPSRASCTVMSVRGMTRLRIEERDALPIAHARAPARDARRHHRLAIGVERRQRGERGERFGREDVGVSRFEVAPNLQHQRPPEDVRTAAPGFNMNFCTRQFSSSPTSRFRSPTTHESACTQPNCPSFASGGAELADHACRRA